MLSIGDSPLLLVIGRKLIKVICVIVGIAPSAVGVCVCLFVFCDVEGNVCFCDVM